MHFTYERRQSADDLRQGDILLRSPSLERLLAEVHPHYKKDDYHAFLVLTQSCDLVRRDNGPCGSRYVTICACRPLETALRRQLELYQHANDRIAGVCDESSREPVKRFLIHLLNNNEATYFYLHDDLELGLQRPLCAFLQLSIAIRAENHYQTCVGARIGGLVPPFQAKLGHLVGYMYSRVGTDDWVPNNRTQDEFNEMVSEIADTHCIWLNNKRLAALRKRLGEQPPDHQLSKADIDALLEGVQLPSTMDRALQRLGQIASDTKKLSRLSDDDQFAQFLTALRNDQVFASLLKK